MSNRGRLRKWRSGASTAGDAADGGHERTVAVDAMGVGGATAADVGLAYRVDGLYLMVVATAEIQSGFGMVSSVQQ